MKFQAMLGLLFTLPLSHIRDKWACNLEVSKELFVSSTKNRIDEETFSRGKNQTLDFISASRFSAHFTINK